MLSLLIIGFCSLVHAATAQVSFVANTNMPGVNVEGKAESVAVKYSAQTPAGASVEIDVFDLRTGMDKRDQHLREKVFAAKNPGEVKIRFEVSNLDRKAGQVAGKLTIKGVSKDVVLPVSVSENEIKGKTAIKLSDYSLPRPSFMGVKVEEAVDVTFNLKE